MSVAPGEVGEQPRAELNELIVRRVRIGLGAIIIGVLVSMAADHAMMLARPRRADVADTIGIGLAVLAFWLLRRPEMRRRPVPLTLVIVAVACGMRAMQGIWFGDLTTTAIFCLTVALTSGASLPWGVWPQLASVILSGSAIAVNAYVVAGDVIQPPPHLAGALAIALAASVVLSFELQQHYRRLFEENRRRRRAEDGLARLNAELELRVVERTAQVAAAKQRLEHEALERQQATHDLRASQKRLQDILDNAPAAIHLKDVDGRYVLVNRHWESSFGIRRQDAVGKTMHEVFPSAIADALRANDNSVLAGHGPLQVEEALMHGDGLHTYVSVKFPLLDADGVPAGVCGISTDITVRKQTEAELRRSEAELSALVENTSDTIWSVDRDGIVRVMNSVFRQRCRQRFGVDYDPKTFKAHVPSELWDDLSGLYERAFQGERVQVERTYPLGSGVRHFLISVHPIVDDGVITGATVFSKDITEYKRVEEQARQHQAELAHVLRLGTMGEMAAGLAHEINQPLGAIANYALGCVRRLRAGSVDAVALLPIIEQIAGEALRAGEIIRRLRELVRKESPQQEVVDLNALVRKAAQMVEAEARHQGIRVQLALAPDLPSVTCDAIQVEQVLLNLLLNGVEAVQASSNGERLLAVSTASAGGDAVEVAIRDSGIGVPEAPVDVFAPFFSTKPHGLGMGLSISRSIIEAHGGRLSAIRNADRGSTFRLTLPLGGEAQPAVDRQAEARVG